MNEKTLKQDILSVYLKVDASACELSSLSINQLILKILYIYDEGLNLPSLKYQIKKTFKVKLNPKRVEGTIQDLVKVGKIKKIEEKMYVGDECKLEIDKTVDDFQKSIDRIIDKYFIKADVEKNILKNWFEETTTLIFQKYYQELLGSLLKNSKLFNKQPKQLNKLIKHSLVSNNNIDKDNYEFLEDKYLEFIKTNDADTNKILWNFGISLLSSILLSNKDITENFTIDIFKNSTIVFDTNVLMDLQLEEDEYYTSLSELENFFDKFNIQLGYFHITEEEYKRAMDRKHKSIAKIFSKFDKKVIMGTNDSFCITAVSRGCSNDDDLQTFFEEMNDVPAVFHKNKKIKKIDNLELVNAINDGISNKTIKEQISKIHFKKYKWKKTEITKEHDSGMIAGVEHIKKEKFCWLITKDFSVKQCCIENVKRDDYPIAINLGTLVNMLCIESGKVEGANQDNFVNLFANIVKLSFIPEEDTYRPEDLYELIKVENQISKLSFEKVKKIAKEINSLRMKNEKDTKIALVIKRNFNSELLALEDDKKNLGVQVETAERISSEERDKSYYIKKGLVKEKVINRRRKYLFQIRLLILIFVILFPSLIIFLGYQLGIFKKLETAFPIWKHYFSSITTVVVWVVFNILKFFPKLIFPICNKLKGVENEVKKEVDKEFK